MKTSSNRFIEYVRQKLGLRQVAQAPKKSLLRKNFKPPNKQNLATAKDLGLTITGNMSDRDVYCLIKDAEKDPKHADYFAEIERRKQQELDEMNIEEYGEELGGEVNHWERLCDGKHYYLAEFLIGKNTLVDIIQFEDVAAERGKPTSVKIYCTRPKIVRDGDDPHLEWDKDLYLKPAKLIRLEELPKEPDIYDISGYKESLEIFA